MIQRTPRSVFILIGDGPLLEETRSAAAGEPRIHVVGHRSDVARLYVGFDVFLLASAWEGLPRTILEAQAAGIPVVATDVNGVREAVHHGDTGLLVPLGHIDGLAEQVSRLLEDDAERQRFSVAARDGIRSDFSEKFTVEATAQLYRELLATADGRRRSRDPSQT